MTSSSKLPPSLKPVQPYVLLAKNFAKRNAVVAYFANMYAVQEGIKLGHDQDAKVWLLGMVDQLTETKKRLSEDDDYKDAFQDDSVASALIEEIAFKLFDHADQQDRASRFTKDTIKSFLTTAHIFTIAKQFGELSDEVEEKMKYAKWKAVEIDRCLKTGVTPTPGPPGGDGLGDVMSGPPSNPADASTSDQLPGERPVPKPRQNLHSDIGFAGVTPSPPNPTPHFAPNPTSQIPDSTPPAYTPPSTSYHQDSTASAGLGGGGAFQAGPEEIAKAQKFSKFACSSMDYDDVPGAIDFLQKAINVLRTGKE